MWWEREERQATALWIAGLSSGGQGLPTPDDIWVEFNRRLNAAPVRRSRNEAALRRVLGVRDAC